MSYSTSSGKHIEILDTTLRDGEQAEGVSFTLADKLNIAKILDVIGVNYIEAGNPASNQKESEFFAEIKKHSFNNSKPVAFGSTRRKNRTCSNDESIKSILSADTPVVSIFGKSWDLHIEEVLNISQKENLDIIGESCAYLKQKGKEVIFDAEHFFDGYKTNKDYAIEVLKTADKAGADVLVLCDTNGGTFPYEVSNIVRNIKLIFPDKRIGIHCHNDNGCAIANTIEAVFAGAIHIQGTYLGFGERCGNAALTSLIANLQLKLGYSCIPNEKLSMLTSVAHQIAEIANMPIRNDEPYIGDSAFAHKAGMHADGVLKCPQSFEHINPTQIGNERRFLMSEIAGRAAVLERIKGINPNLERDSNGTKAVMSELKRLESIGYQFEGADGSFEIMARKQLGLFKSSFELVSYKLMDELPYDTNNPATVTIKIKVGDKLQISAAEGDGPINALDRALREALSIFYPQLHTVKLIDYKVRVLEVNSATAAKVRVLITSTDGVSVWSTVGVSSDIIEASWLALVDSIEYKLKNN